MPDDILGGYTKEGYLKTWNYYAVDVYDKTTTCLLYTSIVVCLGTRKHDPLQATVIGAVP